jgi:transposase
LLNGSINGESYLIDVCQVLVPTLHQGDIVVMDNFGSHTAKAIRDAVRDVGVRLIFLPPYSPNLKHLLRKVKERKEEAVNDRIGPTIRASSPAECRNCITNAGYSSI